MENKTHWKKTCNPNYLGSWDLDDSNGGFKKITLTIDTIKEEQVMNPEISKTQVETVCYFKEKYKPMILNNTNKQAIAKATCSNYLEDWEGKQITIEVKKVKAFGDLWDALRVSPIPVKIEMAKCDCCGKEMRKSLYDQTKEAYGYGVCCKECKEKMLNKTEEDK